MNDANYVRIKVNICNDTNNKFWYFLNTNLLLTIEQVENDLKRILVDKFNCLNLNDKQLRLHVQNYMLPSLETSSIIRDGDLIEVKFDDKSRKRAITHDKNNENKVFKKQKVENVWSLTNVIYDPSVVYNLSIFGTSMIKHIRIDNFLNINGINNVFLKSISGGKIQDVYNFIRARKFTQCKYFILTVGSNDCDCANNSSNFTQKIIDEYMVLINYLKESYLSSKIFVNQLVPRTRTRYSKEVFETNRVKLNSYLEECSDENLVFIKHPAFEDIDKLSTLLYDGVHIHPVNGVPIYVDEIKSVVFFN